MEKLVALVRKIAPANADLSDIEAAVKDLVDSETAGLRAKRDELLGEVKKLKSAGRSPDEADKLRDEVEQLQARLADKTREAEKAVKAAEKERSELAARLASETAAVARLVRDEGLLKAVAEVGVKREFIPAVSALLRDRVTVAADGDTRRAIVSTKDKTGKAVELSVVDYVKEWSQGDEGRHYVAAPVNTGGGSTGAGSGGQGPTTMTRASFDALTPEARTVFAKSGGKLTD